MASTNKTPNYNLSQFIGTDKPAWLADYNSDMEKIDTAIKNTSDATATAQTTAETAQSSADSAGQTASTALNTAQTASSTATTAQTTAETASSNASTAISTANEAKTTADGLASDVQTAQTTANTANSKADTNASNITTLNNNVSTLQTEVSSLQDKFKFTTFENIPASDFGTQLNGALTLAKNADGSVFKLYGTIQIINAQYASIPRTEIPGLSGTYGVASGKYLNSGQTEGIVINCGSSQVFTTNATTFSYVSPLSCAIGTDGQLYMFAGSTNAMELFTGDSTCMIFPACIYINSNFGDEPVTPPSNE